MQESNQFTQICNLGTTVFPNHIYLDKSKKWQVSLQDVIYENPVLSFHKMSYIDVFLCSEPDLVTIIGRRSYRNGREILKRIRSNINDTLEFRSVRNGFTLIVPFSFSLKLSERVANYLHLTSLYLINGSFIKTNQTNLYRGSIQLSKKVIRFKQRL